MPSGVTGIIDLAGDRSDAPRRAGCLYWFRLFVLMHVAVRTFYTLEPLSAPDGPWYGWLSQFLMLCCLGGLVPIYTQLATRMAAAVVAIQLVMTMPLTANHVFLELVVLGVLALLDEEDEREGELLAKALRWITVIFFFYSGLQKVLWGYYFDGQFLSWVSATETRFGEVFRHMMPAEEYERLQGLAVPGPGAGPYRVDAPLFVVVSNLVYVFEMVAPVLMIVRRTRTLATLAAIVFIVMIELGARELIFGGLMIYLLLLFLDPRWTKRLFPVFAAAYFYLVLARFGWVPMFVFSA